MNILLRRTIGVAALGTCLMLTTAAIGQQPPTAEEKLKRLDLVLQSWAHTMGRVEKFEAKCERETEDKVFQTVEKYSGTVRFMKEGGADPAVRLSLNLVKTDNPKVFEQFIVSKGYLYEFAPAAKEIRAHELPRPKPGAKNDHNLVALFTGANWQDAKQRYSIEHTGSDENYTYLVFEPRRAEDKAEFSKARLVLIKNTYLPRELSFFHPNGNRVTWALSNVNTDAKNLTAAAFDVTAPPGWKMTTIPLRAPADAPQAPPK